MMVPVVGHPTCRSSRAVEHGAEDQHVVDDLVQLESAVRQHAMVTDRRAETTESREEKSKAEDSYAGQWKQNQANDSQYVYQDKVKKNGAFAACWSPKGLFPGSNLLNSSLAHASSCRAITRTPLASFPWKSLPTRTQTIPLGQPLAFE